MAERSFTDPIESEALVPDPIKAGYPVTQGESRREWYDRLLDKHDLPLVLVGAILGCVTTVLFMTGVFVLAKFGG